MATIYHNLKDGKIVSFKFKAFLGRDKKGRQLFKCRTWVPEKNMSENRLIAQAEKEATIWERLLLEEISNQEQKLSPSEITLREFAENIWVPSQLKSKDYRPSTITFHTSLLKIILSYLGEMKLNSISCQNIESYLYYLKNTYKTAKNCSPAPKTVRHHYSTLNLIFQYAVKTDYISFNPLSKIDIPKLTKHKVDALSNHEVVAFIKEVDKLPEMQKLIYYLLLTTGMRRGECFGLQWRDIDFETQTIRIERNVTYSASSGISVGLPKTNAGIREIPVTNKVLNLLTGYKISEQNKYSIATDMFLFHSSASPSLPHDPTYITKHMKKFMKKAGLPDMSPHDLRHTCASMLLQSGADIKSVQDILGHTDASTTLNFYAKSDINIMRKSAQKAFDL